MEDVAKYIVIEGMKKEMDRQGESDSMIE